MDAVFGEVVVKVVVVVANEAVVVFLVTCTYCLFVNWPLSILFKFPFDPFDNLYTRIVVKFSSNFPSIFCQIFTLMRLSSIQLVL